MNKTQARALLDKTRQSNETFVQGILDLVVNRAWDILGYQNFIHMWESKEGFRCPTYAKVLAVKFLAVDVFNPALKQIDMAEMIGFRVGKGTSSSSKELYNILSQLRKGVSEDKVSPGTDFKRTAKTEFHIAGFEIARDHYDAVKALAESLGLPMSEIYRQAVAEFLHKRRAKKAA